MQFQNVAGPHTLQIWLNVWNPLGFDNVPPYKSKVDGPWVMWFESRWIRKINYSNFAPICWNAQTTSFEQSEHAASGFVATIALSSAQLATKWMPLRCALLFFYFLGSWNLETDQSFSGTLECFIALTYIWQWICWSLPGCICILGFGMLSCRVQALQVSPKVSSWCSSLLGYPTSSELKPL